MAQTHPLSGEGPCVSLPSLKPFSRAGSRPREQALGSYRREQAEGVDSLLRKGLKCSTRQPSPPRGEALV